MTARDEVRAAICYVLQIEEPADNDVLAADSLERMWVVVILEDRLGVEVPDAATFQWSTVAELTATVDACK